MELVAEALRASRRLNSFATAVRILEVRVTNRIEAKACFSPINLNGSNINFRGSRIRQIQTLTVNILQLWNRFCVNSELLSVQLWANSKLIETATLGPSNEWVGG